MKAEAELCGNSMTYIIPPDFYCSKTIKKINVVISILEALTCTYILEYFIKTNVVICFKYSRPFTNNSFIFLQQDIIHREMYICMNSLDPLGERKRI